MYLFMIIGNNEEDISVFGIRHILERTTKFYSKFFSNLVLSCFRIKKLEKLSKKFKWN